MSEDRYLHVNGPMHEWFGLSYASYLVLPRSLIQEMPSEWQQRLRQLLREFEDQASEHMDGSDYAVNRRDDRGRFMRDELAPYRRAYWPLPWQAVTPQNSIPEPGE